MQLYIGYWKFIRIMKNEVNRSFMDKKNYNQPKTEIFNVRIENLMLTVSTNSGGGGGGSAHAPKKGDIIY